MTPGSDQNDFLANLRPDARLAITQSATSMALVRDATLIEAGQATTDVFFVETGFLSITVGDLGGTGVEVGLIGREGMVGSWLVLGAETTKFDVAVRSSGSALRLTATAFGQACADHPDLRAAALAHCDRFTGMIADTCQAHARLTVERRLARWLLLAHDRLEGDVLPITHEVLSKMLGVRRPGVTVALHILEGEHMVKATRGLIQILDREKLAHTASGEQQPQSHERRQAA